MVRLAQKELLEALDWPDGYRSPCPIGGQPTSGLRELAGGSEESWTVDVVPTAKKYYAGLQDKTIRPWSSWPEQMFFGVKGDGKFVHAKRHRYDAPQVDR